MSIIQLLYGSLTAVPVPFSPAILFASGEQGVWYDPSDLSTLFQDTAGTTPVTEVGQLVRRMLDKSGRGNHATQTGSSAVIPRLEARYNLLLSTEDWSGPTTPWFYSGSTTQTYQGTGSVPVVTANYATAPDGTMTATRIQLNLNGGTSSNDRSGLVQAVSSRFDGSSYVASCYVKALDATSDAQLLAATRLVMPTSASGSLFTGNIESSNIVDVGNGWKRLFRTVVPNGSSEADPDFTFQIIGNIGTIDSLDILVWGAELKIRDDYNIFPQYQKVVTATNYVTTSTMGGQVFPYYLNFDGSVSTTYFMSTPSTIDFSATDKITVFAGVQVPVNDATSAKMVAELSASSASNNGTFSLYRYTKTSSFVNKGTTLVQVTNSNSLLSTRSVITALGDIGGDICSLDDSASISVQSSGSDQGTGNYGNYRMWIGSRNGASNFLAGRLYSLIVRSSATSAGDITSVETWIDGKMNSP